MNDMNEKYLIIADDFTGSNDTGVQFRRRGYRSAVMLVGNDIPNDISCAVIDTESRAETPEKADLVIKKAVSMANFDDYTYVIKKVDSTLRGNIAAEVFSLDSVFGSELIVFMPALPDLKRTTCNSIHYLKDVRITETELANDPKTPVKQDDLVEILKTVFFEEIEKVTIEDIRHGELEFKNGRVFCCDAVTNDDMQKVISAVQKTKKRTLWVGSAAIADNIMSFHGNQKPAFGVITSLSKVTADQVKEAELAGAEVVSLPFHKYLAGERDWRNEADLAIKLLRSKKDTLIVSSGTLDRDDAELTCEVGQQCSLSVIDVSNYVQRSCGVIAQYILERADVAGVFLAGGDTAMGLLSAIGASGSEIISEISVGIPVMRLVGGNYPGLKVVTKAGAFGDKNAISFAIRKIKEI